MKLLEPILARAGHRCAWCARDLRGIPKAWRERACIDCLDGIATNRVSTNVVASCFECATARQNEWPSGEAYSPAVAVDHLAKSISGPSTFAIYLDGKRTDLAPGVAFQAALARVEAQRWQELKAIVIKDR